MHVLLTSEPFPLCEFPLCHFVLHETIPHCHAAVAGQAVPPYTTSLSLLILFVYIGTLSDIICLFKILH
ncbi:hypothetical protein BDV18DRAFT_135510 [Aspergillus unguis]